MAASTYRLHVLRLAWSGLWRNRRRQPGCSHLERSWPRLMSRRPAVAIEGFRYCVEHCLEQSVWEKLQRTRFAPGANSITHRVPLGLLLLSRQQLTGTQLETALTAQRESGHGRIGEWLQTLGFVTEQQVLAALARQWSCPMLRPASAVPGLQRIPQIPVTLLEAYQVLPVSYVSATSTLHLAFGDRPDYTVLYAIERMLGCRTGACLALPGFVRAGLEPLATRRGENEMVFAGLPDDRECARIVTSYCARLDATEIRLAACGSHLWIRLFRDSRPPLDLVLRSGETAEGILPHTASAS